jgi:hypothetical protein
VTAQKRPLLCRPMKCFDHRSRIQRMQLLRRTRDPASVSFPPTKLDGLRPHPPHSRFPSCPKALKSIGSSSGAMNQFAAKRNGKELSIRYVSGPRNQTSFFFLTLQTPLFEWYYVLSFLLGVYRGAGVYRLPGPTPFVRTDLLVQDRFGTFRDSAQRC